MSTTFLLLSLVPAVAWLVTTVSGRREHLPGGGAMPYVAWAVATAAAHALAQLLGADGWGHVHVAYLVFTVTIPICAGTTLIAELARLPRFRAGRAALAVLGLAPALIGFYATHLEPFRVSLETVTLDVDGIRGGEVRLAVYSDPQMAGLGEHESGALQRLLGLEPHLVLIPGDLFTAPFEVVRDDVREFRRLLRTADAPVLMVTGDHDQPRTLAWLARGTAATVLDGEIVVRTVAGTRVAVAGVANAAGQAAAAALIERLAATAADVRLVLSHEPETAALVVEHQAIDLVVSGDTHGGQVRLPIIGLPYNPSDLPDEVAAGGLHELGATRVYVSRGVGVLRGQAPQVRFGAPPSIDLITLR